MDKPLIAVVNDDTAFLSLMNELLTDEGYRTFLHTVGKTSYETIKEMKPDLVILDIRMETPEAGWVTLDLLRLDPATKDIPVIVSSADSQILNDKSEQFQKHNCVALPKPFDLEELLSKVRQLVGTP